MWSGVIACKNCMNLTYYELCCFTNNFHSLDTFKSTLDLVSKCMCNIIIWQKTENQIHYQLYKL